MLQQSGQKGGSGARIPTFVQCVNDYDAQREFVTEERQRLDYQLVELTRDTGVDQKRIFPKDLRDMGPIGWIECAELVCDGGDNLGGIIAVGNGSGTEEARP